MTDKLGEATFVTEGFNNWKKATERFDHHEKSGLHREAMLKLEMLNQPGIDAHLNSQHKLELKTRRDSFLILMSSLQYLLRQGLAIRGHEDMEGNLMQLLLLRAKDNRGLQKFISERCYLSAEITTELIGLMAKRVRDNLLSEIKKAGMFSLIADETTDISHKEQLCIAIRWVDDLFWIHEAPLHLIDIPQTNAETISYVIKSL